jgi:hypothetical protein
MEVKVMCGAQYAYACLKAENFSMDVQLSHGKSAEKSLRQSAAEMIEDAQRRMARANRMLQAAAILEAEKAGKPPVQGSPVFLPIEAPNPVFGEASEIEKIVSVQLQSIVGEYDTPDTVQEWGWIENNASFAHTKNGITAGVWEFIINPHLTFEDVPERLAQLIQAAREENKAFILFHQG